MHKTMLISFDWMLSLLAFFNWNLLLAVVKCCEVLVRAINPQPIRSQSIKEEVQNLSINYIVLSKTMAKKIQSYPFVAGSGSHFQRALIRFATGAQTCMLCCTIVQRLTAE